jgi:hypothetical protein
MSNDSREQLFQAFILLDKFAEIFDVMNKDLKVATLLCGCNRFSYDVNRLVIANTSKLITSFFR